MKTTNFERFLMYTVLIGGMIGVWFIKDLETAYKVILTVLNLTALACVSYLDNSFWKPEKAKVTYYLFGGSAARIYHEEGMEGLIKAMNEGLDYNIYAHPESDWSVNLIDEYDGYNEYCVITLDEYVILLKARNQLDN